MRVINSRSVCTDLKVCPRPAGWIGAASPGGAPAGIDAGGGQPAHLSDARHHNRDGNVGDAGQDGALVGVSDPEASGGPLAVLTPACVGHHAVLTDQAAGLPADRAGWQQGCGQTQRQG